jgi:uncharacterized protein DUF5709
MTDDSDGVDGVDIDNGLLEDDETLDGRGVDVLDEGYTVPERPWEREHYGVTAREAHEPESLTGRLARELPDISDTDDEDGLGDAAGTDGELYDDEVGVVRSGRLVDVEAAGEWDDFAYLNAVDVGRDGGAASAEEAAVHVVRDPDDV